MNKKYLLFVGLMLSVSGISIAMDSKPNKLRKPQAKFHQAILNDSPEEMKQTLLSLLNQGKDGKDEKSSLYVLLKAIITETTEDIKQAVQPIINQSKDEKSPLIWAVLLKKSNAVKTLIECGAKVDSTIMQYATKMGDLKTILEIVKSGADVSTYMQDYMVKGLHNISNPNLKDVAFELVQELINHGFNINDAWNSPYFNYLFRKQDEATLKFFLEKGANPIRVTGVSTFGTPLLIAVCYGNKQAAEILLNAGADINEKGLVDRAGKPVLTPLSCAVNDGNAEMVEFLLMRGASL